MLLLWQKHGWQAVFRTRRLLIKWQLWVNYSTTQLALTENVREQIYSFVIHWSLRNNDLKAGEVSEFTNSFAASNGNLVVFGDFSVHCDSQEDTDTNCLRLKISGQPTSFSMWTGIQGHVPDLVITLLGGSVCSVLSAHFLVNTEDSLWWPLFPAIFVSHRKYRLLDLTDHELVLDPPDLDQLFDLYESILRDLINKYTGLRLRQIPQSALISWYVQYIQTVCRQGTYCEWLWVRYWSDQVARLNVRNILVTAKSCCYYN